mgnify:CR=1 FL=1
MEVLTLVKRIEELPTDQQQQVEGFVAFLESQYNKKSKSLAKRRRANRGMAKGKVMMSESFNEPLEDFEDYM